MKRPDLIDRIATALAVLGAALVVAGLTGAALTVMAGWAP